MRLFETSAENQGRKLALPPPSATLRTSQTKPNILDVRTVDEEAVPISITVAPTGRIGDTAGVSVVQPSDPQYANAVVVAEWGAAGGVARVEIDVGRGVMFCLCASRVRLWALGQTGIDDFSPTILTGQPNQAATELQAWATYGATPCAPPTRTAKAVSVADGGGALGAGLESALIPIPAFARRAFAVVAPAAQPVQVRWYRTAAGELVGADLASADNIVPPPSATYFSVFNVGPGALDEARVRFELAL